MGRRLQCRERQGYRSPRGPGCGGPDPARRDRHRAGSGAAGCCRSGVDHGWRGDHTHPASRVQVHGGGPGLPRPGWLRGVGPLLRPRVLHRLTGCGVFWMPGPKVTEQSAPEGVTLLKELMMRVFVAGATGAIGKQLVPRLVEAGHEGHGMTRSESKKAMLDALGAVPGGAGAPAP